MMIHPNTAMRLVTVDGITVKCNTQDAKDFAKKYPNAVIKRMYPKRKSKNPRQICVNVPVDFYMSQK
jgi:DNA transposition AAA+ family ATPase